MSLFTIKATIFLKFYGNTFLITMLSDMIETLSQKGMGGGGGDLI